jgi:hypothetical protein
MSRLNVMFCYCYSPGPQLCIGRLYYHTQLLTFDTESSLLVLFAAFLNPTNHSKLSQRLSFSSIGKSDTAAAHSTVVAADAAAAVDLDVNRRHEDEPHTRMYFDVEYGHRDVVKLRQHGKKLMNCTPYTRLFLGVSISKSWNVADPSTCEPAIVLWGKATIITTPFRSSMRSALAPRTFALIPWAITAKIVQTSFRPLLNGADPTTPVTSLWRTLGHHHLSGYYMFQSLDYYTR